MFTRVNASCSEFNRQLLHAIVWAPLEHFTEVTMELSIMCWEWLLAARQDVQIQVTFTNSSCERVFFLTRAVLQFLQEIRSAWTAAVQLRLGIFRPDPPVISPLAAREGVQLAPNPPFLKPHKAWIRVGVLKSGLI
jgi:phosphatidylinositol 4-kinase